MDPQAVTAILTIADYLLSRAEAEGDIIPDSVLEARTELRRSVVAAANDMGSEPED